MADLIRKAPFSPLFTGSALYLLTRAPSSVRQPLLEQLHQVLAPHNLGRLVTGLKWLFALGIVRNINTYLTEWAGNNFYFSSNKQDWVWEQEICVVTGASSGFGALFSKDLSARGIHVVALDINELPPHLQNNPKISFFKCDVTDAEAVKDVAKSIQSTIGHPTILINNAGIGAGKSVLKTSPDFLKKIFGVNLFSHWYTVQAFLPAMLARKKGHIVSIASVASFVSAAQIVDYAASKVGALAFHEGLSSELRVIHKCPEIKTTIVHPIWADTPLIAEGVDQLKKAGQMIINPQMVSDAVVKQITSCRGGQVIIAGGAGSIISSLRGFPGWLQETLRRTTERASQDLSQMAEK
ncbi:hypothetical protein MBLNU459_g7234t1 [Dothideomycetes sp. NU459]